MGIFGAIGAGLGFASGVMGMYGKMQKRNYEVEQMYLQAEFFKRRVIEEDYKYQIKANSIDRKAQNDIKQYISGVASSGFRMSGSVLENITQIQNISYEEKYFNERMRQSVVSSLQMSEYNYKRMAKKTDKVGIFQDIAGGIGAGLGLNSLGKSSSKDYLKSQESSFVADYGNIFSGGLGE